MKRVTLHFYNAQNLGDDLFVNIVAQRYLNDFYISYRAKNGSFRDIANIKTRSMFLYDLVLRIKNRIFQNEVIVDSSALKAGDIIIYVGGSIFIEGVDMKTWRRKANFYRNIGKPYYILGSNIGPHKNDGFLSIVRSILSGAQDVCLRDEASFELMNDLPNVRISTDIAFTLDTSQYLMSNEKIAVFSLIDGLKKFDDRTTEKYEHQIRALTRKLLNDGSRVVYMSFCKSEGDEDAIVRILSKFSYSIKQQIEIFNYRGDLQSALALLAKSQIIIGSRFHANILGLIFGKKVLPMAYSDKTTDILKDMNFPGQVIDIRKIDEFDASSIDVETIPVMDTAKQINLAELQFQELDKVLVKRK